MRSLLSCTALHCSAQLKYNMLVATCAQVAMCIGLCDCAGRASVSLLCVIRFMISTCLYRSQTLDMTKAQGLVHFVWQQTLKQCSDL
jgi:hypothetical protein